MCHFDVEINTDNNIYIYQYFLMLIQNTRWQNQKIIDLIILLMVLIKDQKPFRLQ